MSQNPILLIIEDDLGLCEQLQWCFAPYQVEIAHNQEQAITKLRRFEPGVITLDVGLPPDPNGHSEGLTTLKAILSLAPHTKVIMLTGQQERSIAIEAIGLGAYDFYYKPVDVDTLKLMVTRAQHLYELEKAYANLASLNNQHKLKGIITGHTEMLKVCQMVEKIAPIAVTTLLLGESGTGKELLARALHELSPRKHKPFVAINCAAIPENLLESELFGYEKGAFTGAAKQTLGKLELAHEGSLFLDEIGDLPLALQPKLLRFLQERTIERIGGRTAHAIDVRIICATHQNLQEKITSKLFREDFFYRIGEIVIDIPPLRARGTDVVLIARIFLSQSIKSIKKNIKGFTDEAIQSILKYSWPGNVRELENKIKRAAILAETPYITAKDLALPTIAENLGRLNLKEIREEVERNAVLQAYALANGNLSKVSQLLGITRPTLYNLIEKLKLKINVESLEV